jgi:hypothetical protein
MSTRRPELVDGCDRDAAAGSFGLTVRDTMMRRADKKAFRRSEKGGVHMERAIWFSQDWTGTGRFAENGDLNVLG